jgi:hypothetical protein
VLVLLLVLLLLLQRMSTFHCLISHEGNTYFTKNFDSDAVVAAAGSCGDTSTVYCWCWADLSCLSQLQCDDHCAL